MTIKKVGEPLIVIDGCEVVDDDLEVIVESICDNEGPLE